MTALLQAQKSSPNIIDKIQILAIAQPKAYGQCYLPGAEEEVKSIRDQAPSSFVSVKTLLEQDATIAKVKEEMITHDWVHFACHADQNLEKPFESGFYLHGKNPKLLIRDIVRHGVPQGELVSPPSCIFDCTNQLSD